MGETSNRMHATQTRSILHQNPNKVVLKMFYDPMTSCEREGWSLFDNCCVVICLFIWDEKATSPVFLHDINHKYKWQDWIECLNTDASSNKSIIVIIKCQPLIILFRNVSSTQRSFLLKGHNAVMAGQEAKQPVLVVIRSMDVFVNKWWSWSYQIAFITRGQLYQSFCNR